VDAPLADGRFPVIVFGHGYLSTVERYESTLSDLARRGFLVVAPRSGDGLLPSHQAFARDFSTTIDWLEQEDVRVGSWLHEAVLRGVYGASGHSMGGGVSLLAAAADPRFRTVANLAAAETRPSAIDVMASIPVPVLLIAGSQDAITPVADHQQQMFDAKSNGPAALRVIEGGSHCGFLDPDVLLALACDSGDLAAESQRSITVDLLGDWFRYVLGADATLEPVVWSAVRDPLVGLKVKGR
jgi:dienelactone hydrolase